ncbi:MAG: hypothetical protein VX910_01165 [Candidatus Latescibacterota bacterium]|nr:hypothetical protein [Candidatus Latescibacterota bacterium]
MSGTVTPASGSTFDTIPVAPESDDSLVTVEITESNEDSFELSSTAGDSTSAYGPLQFSDRFKFDIQNGMFDAKLRFNAAISRSRGADVATYSERQAVEFQVTRAAGTDSSSSALFALQFQDANPNSTSVGSHLEGRTEFKRMAEQNLALLSIL